VAGREEQGHRWKKAAGRAASSGSHRDGLLRRSKEALRGDWEGIGEDLRGHQIEKVCTVPGFLVMNKEQAPL
jgi:hypothetical protein